jgi:DNA-binding MarR family transcriptional regulator
MNDLDAIQKLLDVIAIFRRLDPHFPIQWVFAFLYIAGHEGCLVGDVARVLRVVPPTATVVLNSLGKPRLGLITRSRNPSNRREKRVVLTPRGKALVRQIRTTLESSASPPPP